MKKKLLAGLAVGLMIIGSTGMAAATSAKDNEKESNGVPFAALKGQIDAIQMQLNNLQLNGAIKGEKGDQGVAGPTGPEGDQGPQGVAGPQGMTGLQGPQGLTGPKGDTGPQGSQGLPGTPGTKGDKGDQGPQGVAGPQGGTGVQGPKGDTGSQGLQGVPGLPGKGLVKYELVGHSSNMVNGGAGVIGMTQACQAEFTGSRMCTSEEVMNSANFGSFNPTALAWVRPVVISTSVGYSEILMDASGVKNAGSAGYAGMSCQGWRSGGDNGLSVDKKGSFSLNSCATIQPVACCSPSE